MKEIDMQIRDLMDEMTNDECPICRLTTLRSQRRMAFLLYENINDMDTRNAFLDSNGFCEHHSTLMLHHGDPLGHAIMYGHLLKNTIHRLEDKSTTRKKSTPCTFCLYEDKNEKHFINAFVRFFSQPDFNARYQKSGLLCTRHFEQSLQLMQSHKNPSQSQLKRITLDKYRALLFDLDEIKRKSDYRNQEETWTEREKKAWKKVVSLLIHKNTQKK